MTSAGHPQIVGAWAYAQSGKDTLAEAFVREVGFERKALADKLREAMYALNPLIGQGRRLRDLVDHIGWEKAKKVAEVRCLLQRGGTEMGRYVLGGDVWVNALFAELEPGGRYIITDVRFPNEAERIKSLNGDMWRIHRPGFGPVNDHYSEVALADWPFDVVINNDRTVEDLHADALAALQERLPLLGHT